MRAAIQNRAAADQLRRARSCLGCLYVGKSPAIPHHLMIVDRVAAIFRAAWIRWVTVLGSYLFSGSVLLTQNRESKGPQAALIKFRITSSGNAISLLIKA
ncbi:Uncharacterised protein [Vibrio cholerae]|nr:Uncharacterised protein [Vibrio cholerae]